MNGEPNRLTSSESEPVSSESEESEFVPPDEIAASSRSPD